LQDFLQKFPDSPLQTEALFTLGFLTGAAPTQKYQEGVEWLRQIVDKYPQDQHFAPEALWHIALFHEAADKPAEAIAALQQLLQKYPNSPRRPYVAGWVEELQNPS